MKTVVALFACMILAYPAIAAEQSAEHSSPQPRARLDPLLRDATDGRQSPAAPASASTVTMERYVVKEAPLRSNAPLVEIPQGAPARTGSQFLDALQSGTVLQHAGKKVTTEVFARGEGAPGGFARLALGYRVSW